MRVEFLFVLLLLLILLDTGSHQQKLRVHREIVLLELDLVAVFVAHLVLLGYCGLFEGYLGVGVGFFAASIGFEVGPEHGDSLSFGILGISIVRKREHLPGSKMPQPKRLAMILVVLPVFNLTGVPSVVGPVDFNLPDGIHRVVLLLESASVVDPDKYFGVVHFEGRVGCEVAFAFCVLKTNEVSSFKVLHVWVLFIIVLE